MNFVYLVKLVVAWEKWEQREYFEVNAAHSPVVHFVIIVAVGEQTLRRAVPTRADILCEGRLGVDAATRSEIGQLNLVLLQQDILSTSD